jgi:hypothetical protein
MFKRQHGGKVGNARAFVRRGAAESLKTESNHFAIL